MALPPEAVLEQYYLRSAMHESGALSSITDNLSGVIDLPSRPFPRYGNPVFNAYSAACAQLGQNYSVYLSQEPIRPPEDFALSHLGSLLIDLVNSRFSDQLVPLDLQRNSGPLRNVCPKTEENFSIALGHNSNGHLQTKSGESNELYLTHDGQLAFITKGYEVRSTLSWLPIRLNGAIHPAGTLFAAKRQYLPGAKAGLLIDSSTTAYLADSVATLRPLRLSSYALPVDEREVALSEHTKWDSALNLSWPEAELTLPELGKFLPGPDELAEVAEYLASVAFATM